MTSTPLHVSKRTGNKSSSSTALAQFSKDGNHTRTLFRGKSSELYLLPEVAVTATREERLLFEVPHAVTTIEPEELARQTSSTLPDLLRGTTGVFVQQTTAGQAAPVIRGLIGSSVLMLVDGMRLNSAFFRPAPYQYFALIDPYNGRTPGNRARPLVNSLRK